MLAIRYHIDFFGGFFFIYKNLQFWTIWLCNKKYVTEKRTRIKLFNFNRLYAPLYQFRSLFWQLYDYISQNEVQMVIGQFGVHELLYPTKVYLQNKGNIYLSLSAKLMVIRYFTVKWHAISEKFIWVFTYSSWDI